ncbi:MAG: beta-lactamase family protein [Pirellulales bacterium]|nr:beta-lactamase family protein [Pirellulales bacterium]
MADFHLEANEVLREVVGRAGGIPGVVASATNREADVYIGSAGHRSTDSNIAMSSDSVMLLASCTKAITGVAIMQLVEEGALALKDPVKRYVPEIAEIQVLDGFEESGKPKLRAPKHSASRLRWHFWLRPK